MLSGMEEDPIFVDNEHTPLTEHEVNLATTSAENPDFVQTPTQEASVLGQGTCSVSASHFILVSVTADIPNPGPDGHTTSEHHTTQYVRNYEEDTSSHGAELMNDVVAPNSPLSHSTGMLTSDGSGGEEQLANDEDKRDGQSRPQVSGDVDENCAGGIEAENENNEGDVDDDESYISSKLPQSVRKDLKELLRRMNMQRPYSPETDDPTPSLQSYSPHFRQARTASEEVADGLNDIFTRSSCSDHDIAEFGKRLKKQSRFRPPKPVVIGLLGDSGVGKSSLINSLLSMIGIAITGAGSRACTNNTIEYSYCFENQMAPFEIHVYFKDFKERCETLKGLLQRYVMHQQTALDAGTEEFSHSFMEAESALEIFQTMFRDYDEFSNDKNSRRFLGDATISRNDLRLTKMCDWLEQLVSKYQPDNNVMRLEANTPVELSKKIEPFVRTPSVGFGGSIPSSPWPIIQLVKIGLDSVILRDGLVIADVPGISDINRTRVNSAYQYLHKCDFLLVCANMPRVETNPGVMSQLTDAFRSHGGQKALIVTKADEVGESSDMQASSEEHQNLLELRTELSSVGRELKELNDKKKTFKRRNFPQDMQYRIEDLIKYKLLLEKVEKGRCMQILNRQTSQALQTSYTARTGDKSKLEVWCVSNSEYMQHLQDSEEDSTPIPVEYTGIPALRLRLRGMTEGANVKRLKLYIENSLPSVLTRAEIWSQPQAEKRHEKLAETLVAGLEDCEALVDSHGKVLNDLFQALILDPIRMNQDSWTAQAKDISSAWTNKARWNANTFWAWVRRMGKHKTKTKEFEDWNEQLLKPVNDTLHFVWKAFEEELLASTFDSLIKSLREAIDIIKEELVNSCSDSLPNMSPFYENLSVQKRLIEEHVTEERAEFEGNCK